MNFSVSITPTRAIDDLLEFKKRRFPEKAGEILKFSGAEGYDVYNTSVPFDYRGTTVMAGRVESRDSEASTTMFFEKTPEGYKLMPQTDKIKNLQDPFVAEIGGRLILGGVDAIWRDDGSLVTYHTDFYDASELSHPRHIIHGPAEMKDIRLLELPDGRVAVFTRPNGRAVAEYGITAAVGFVLVDDLREVTEKVIAEAPLIKWLFADDEWGGCNQLHNLKNGLVGIIGHKSWGEMIGGAHILHYYCFASAIDPDTREIAPLKIIGSRECFPPLDCKNPRVKDVCFTSGIIRNGDGTAYLYSGLNDCGEGVVKIEDPFAEYENN